MSKRRVNRLVSGSLILSSILLLPGCAEMTEELASERVARAESTPEASSDSSTPAVENKIVKAAPAKPKTREDLAAERGFYHNAKTNSYFSNGQAAFSFRIGGVTNDSQAISVSINDEEYVPYEGKLNFEDEGSHRIRFRATDSLGNWSPLQDFKVFVDTTPPVLNAFWQGPNIAGSDSIFVSGLSTFTISAYDSGSGVSKIMLEEAGSAAKEYSGEMKFKDGKHSIRYYAVDNVGNHSEPVELEFQVDSTAPTTKAILEGAIHKVENKTYVNGNAQVILKTGETVSGIDKVEYTINGGPVTTYQAPIIVSDSKMEIKFRATDRAGNQEAWKMVNVLSDSTPPIIKLETIGKYILKSNRFFSLPGFYISVNSKDDDSGLADISYSRDGKTFASTKDGKIVFDKSGEYHFSARATDHVGNVTESNPYVVIVDNSAPQSRVRENDRLILKNGVYYSGLPSQIEIHSDDQGGIGVEKIEYSFDGKAFSPYIGAIDASQWTTQKRTLYFRATDRLGQMEPVKTAAIELQTEGPQVDLMIESGNAPEVPLSSLVLKKDKDAATTEVKEEPKAVVQEEVGNAPEAVDIMVESPGLKQVPVSTFVEEQEELDNSKANPRKKKNKKNNKKNPHDL